jgi:hypothetical protein
MKTPKVYGIAAAIGIAGLGLVLPVTGPAATIYQSTGGSYIAFEAESTASITNSSPTFWVITNDATANGGKAIYQAGANGTASSSSFALYSLNFSQPGIYSIYYRWRADKSYTDLDPNSANSFRLPVDFGDLTNDATSVNFVTASVNNAVSVPAANSYNVFKDSATYTVTQAELDSGSPLILKVGTREAGMFIDRFVLSTNDTLTEADFNALVNSDTEVVVQGAQDSFIGFQAERVGPIENSAPTFWVVTNDATANGGKAIYQAGVNGTASSSSFALYSLTFSKPGVYSVYYRWRADKAYTDLDPNSANSFRLPVDFGDLTNDATSANFPTASVNNAVAVPAANSYNVFKDSATYTVSQEQVDAGLPLVFKVGTREAGMFIDRFVFSTNSSLAEADINALPDSGSHIPPKLLKAVGSATLADVTITFDAPLSAASTNLSHFNLSGGLTALSATLNPTTSRDIVLTTSAQSPGSNYVVTVNGVVDVGGNQIAPNSTVHFTAWKLSSGWVTREFYLNVDTNNAGGGVADLQADAKFPNSPNLIDVAKGFQINNDITGNNYGARLRAFFAPPTSGVYEFFIYNDDAAQASLSSDQTEANLAPLVDSPAVQASFDSSVMGTSGALVAGQRYLLQVLYRQNTGSALLGVAARRQGDTTLPSSLPVLGGSLISTFINPEAGAISFAQQPTDATASAGGRARFAVKATSLGPTLYYQWQLNGVDIPGATRAGYVTPVLSTSDSGNAYQVVVSAAGNSVPSASAHLTVVPGSPGPDRPYIGVNFVGTSAANSGGGSGGVLTSNDVAGVVQQENFNNLADTTASEVALFDNTGVSTPVTINYDTLSLVTTGTGDSDADHALFQGYIHNNNAAMTLTLNHIPAGTNYSLLLYSVGFNFNTTYEQAVDVTGGQVYPTLHVRGQDASQYLASPGYVLMSSTDPSAPQLGNYTRFDNVSPAADGSLTIVITPESTNTGITYLPALNALQLVKVVAVATPASPSLTVTKAATSLSIGWTASATGFTLESSPALGAGATWTAANGVPNPITGAGSLDVSPGAAAQRFYRLKK